MFLWRSCMKIKFVIFYTLLSIIFNAYFSMLYLFSQKVTYQTQFTVAFLFKQYHHNNELRNQVQSLNRRAQQHFRHAKWLACPGRQSKANKSVWSELDSVHNSPATDRRKSPWYASVVVKARDRDAWARGRTGCGAANTARYTMVQDIGDNYYGDGTNFDENWICSVIIVNYY